MWLGALPKAGGPLGDRTSPPLPVLYPKWLPDRTPDIPDTGPREGLAWLGKECPGLPWLLLGSPAFLPSQLPAFAVLLKQQPCPKWACFPLSWAHAYPAGCRWLALCPCCDPGPEFPARPSGQCLATWLLGLCSLPPGDRPALAALGLRQERRSKAVRPEGRKSRREVAIYSWLCFCSFSSNASL